MKTPADLHPSGIFQYPDLGFPSLIENVLIRCFFDLRAKERLQWVGVSQRRGGQRAFTCRIRKRQGVYGLFFLGWEAHEASLKKGFFEIKYFPVPEEHVFESFSFTESMIRLREEFDAWLAAAPSENDPLASAFTVGRICMCIDAQDANLLLSLWAPSRWLEFRKDGLRIRKNDGSELLCVPESGLDRNVPAFALSWSFFDRLVASFSVQLEKMPDSIVFKRRPGWVSDVCADGNHEIRKNARVRDKFLSVGFFADERTEWVESLHQWAVTFQPDHWPDSPNETPETIRSVNSRDCSFRRLPFRWTPDLEMMPVPRRVASRDLKPPLIVITGFLGSGKTTLLNQLVEWKALGRHRFVAVIQNELGPIAVDSGLTDGAYDVVDITEGCVCCNLSGDLTKAVQRICTEYRPDLILVETTGTTDPGNLLEELSRLTSYVRFDSLVTVVDASSFLEALHEYSVAREQVALADLIIVNKADLVTERDMDSVRKSLAALNPRANIVGAVQARISPELVFSGGEFTDREGFSREDHRSRERKASPTAGRDSCHLDEDRIRTYTITTPGLLDRNMTLNFLNSLPKAIYRVKGVLSFAGEEMPQLVQYVAERYDIREYPEPTVSPNVLVFIGRDTDFHQLREGLLACVIEADLDVPRI